MVGSPVQGKRVVILDDVMTAGTAVRQSIDLVKAQGGKIVGIVLLLDREEVAGGIDPGPDARSTVDDLEKFLGGEVRVLSNAAHARVNVLARREGEARGSGEHECVPSSLWY